MKTRAKRLIAFLCAIALFSNTGVTNKLFVHADIDEKSTLDLQNPRLIADSAMSAQQKVSYDCIYFGSYPQAEVIASDAGKSVIHTNNLRPTDFIVDSSLYNKLNTATGWNAAGEIVIDGNKYKRLSSSDASYTDSAHPNNYYKWSSDVTYHYFKYQPIKWRVLNTGAGTALLLSDMALDSHIYAKKYAAVTWINSDMRYFLNGYGSYASSNFINTAFSEEEKNSIVTSDLLNNPSLAKNVGGCARTNDKVFCLADSELYSSFATNYGFHSANGTKDEARRVYSSAYAKARGCYTVSGRAMWWTRSAYDSEYITTVFHVDGSQSQQSHGGGANNGVRPALVINLEDEECYQSAGVMCSDGSARDAGGDVIVEGFVRLGQEAPTTTEATTTETTTEATTTEATTEVTTTEATTTEATTTEVTTTEATTTEATTTEATTTEATTTEATTTEATTTEATTTEATTTEATTTEATTTEATTTEATTTEATTTEATTTEVTTTEATTTEATTTEVTTTEATTTEPPIGPQLPSTEASTTEVITTQASTTEMITEGTTQVPMVTTEAPIGPQLPSTQVPQATTSAQPGNTTGNSAVNSTSQVATDNVNQQKQIETFQNSKVKNVTVTTTTGGSIIINWSGDEDQKIYIVYRSNKKDGGYEKVGMITNGGTTYTDTTVKQNVVYYYCITMQTVINGVTYESVVSTPKRYSVNGLRKPKISVKKKRIVVAGKKVKYLQIRLKNLNGKGIALYVKRPGKKYKKMKLKSEKVSGKNKTLKISYKKGGMTLRIKARVWKKRGKKKIYGPYSKVVKIKI